MNQNQLATTASTESTSTEVKSSDGQSLLNQGEPEPQAAPEKYADFKVPDGAEIDKETFEQAAPIFKELNLSQDQAQKLVDFYSDNITKVAQAPYQAFLKMREGWVSEVKADPEIGSKLPEVKATIARALNQLGSLEAPFRQAMDLTGVGDNPAFVKGFYKFAQLITEGQHVSGSKPAPVVAPNGTAGKSMAQVLFPELPSSAAPQRG